MRLNIQNYGCNGNILCDHGVVERNIIIIIIISKIYIAQIQIVVATFVKC